MKDKLLLDWIELVHFLLFLSIQTILYLAQFASFFFFMRHHEKLGRAELELNASAATFETLAVFENLRKFAACHGMD